jgi:hypothetical protein
MRVFTFISSDQGAVTRSIGESDPKSGQGDFPDITKKNVSSIERARQKLFIPHKK